ncbi:MAG: hypothetical protein Q8L48_41775 [Archangium sp.]|nr:hypothetical protein [Archangium sp.]
MRTALILAVLWCAPAEAGKPVPFEEKVLEADLIVEFELPFDAQAMKAPSKGANAVMASGPMGAALARARVVRVIFPAGGSAPAKLPALRFVASGAEGCLELAAKRGTVRALGFFKKKGAGWVQLFGLEQQLPAYTDLDPAWPQLLAAVENRGSDGGFARPGPFAEDCAAK